MARRYGQRPSQCLSMVDEVEALEFDLAMTREMVAREHDQAEQWLEHAGPLGLLLATMTFR